MNDHVERLVQSWFERTEFESDKQRALMSELVNGIHRMVREAENETRARCEEIAIQAAGDDVGGRIALAIRTSAAESLPRKSLTEIYAPELWRQ
jgi:polyhydroxyalkanoate synthesis regulator phasin